jgi:hypothetical protein
MSIQRTAAARRARLREFLRAKTMADATPTQCELLQQLGSPVTEAALRTLRRDLRVLRGSVRKRTQVKRAGGVNRSKVSSNMTVTKKLKQIEERLDGIESVQQSVIDYLKTTADLLTAFRKDDMALLAITNQAAAEHAALRAKCEQMNETFTAAVRAAHYSPHTNH